MAPPVLSLALPSETGRVLSIQSHTVQVLLFLFIYKILDVSPSVWLPRNLNFCKFLFFLSGQKRKYRLDF
jgi:hypothetical protein